MGLVRPSEKDWVSSLGKSLDFTITSMFACFPFIFVKPRSEYMDVRDFGSKVIWFYVLTFLEPPKTCAEIKKTNYFRTSVTHVYYGSTFRTSV